MIKHHPSDETLFRYANGSLEPGPRIVVAVHVGGCAACCSRIGKYEAVGGSLLHDMEPEAMETGAFDRVMAMIDANEAGRDAATPRQRLPRADIGIPLPQVLDDCGIGPWRWIGPGVRLSRVTLPDDDSANVILLKVTAGRRLPEHTHVGSEYTHVLKGAFHDGRGRYGPGDLDEADDDVQHQPIVDKDGECICIAAVEGQTKLQGLLGRLIQPLFGG